MAGPSRSSLVVVVSAAVGALVLGLVAWRPIAHLAGRTAVLPEPDRLQVIVVPHPDDEFQAWSFVERDPSSYKVFVLATRGEETGYCTQKGHAAGWQRDLEPPARPQPRGKWTRSCERARLGSWIGFFEDQASADRSLPGRLRSLGERGPFPDPHDRVCRRDRDGACHKNSSARVWVDRDGRGALVAYDLGDGDLSRREVAWAVRTTLREREVLGLDTSLPRGALIGASFANQRYDCFSYPHADHLAVHEALFEIDFGFEFQAAPTCADDPDASRSGVVSERSARAAFRVAENGRRTGSHTKNYGWLYRPYYQLDRRAQRRLFHTRQEFWVRFAE